MKLLGTLTTILVLGVWTAATIAHEETSGESELAVDDTKEPEDSILLGIGNADIRNLTRENCENNGGGPMAHSAAILGWEIFSNCTESELNTTGFEADSTAAFLSDEWNPHVAKYCGKLPALFQCATNMMDAIRPCLDAERRQTVENHYNITNSFLGYICEKDGNRIASLFAAGGVECIGSNQKELDQSCGMDLQAYLGHVPISNLLWIKLDSLDCANIDKYITCIVGVMRTCENPTSANLIAPAIFDFFKWRKSCTSIPPTQKSPPA